MPNKNRVSQKEVIDLNPIGSPEVNTAGKPDDNIQEARRSQPALEVVPAGEAAPKPISQRKLEANRRNAKRSTGPRTELGKSKSRRNSVKHGALARKVLFDEQGLPQDVELYQYYEQLREEYPCDNLYEEFLRDDLLFAFHGYARTIQLERAAAKYPGYMYNQLPKLQRYYTTHRNTLRQNFQELNELRKTKSWEEESDSEAALDDDLCVSCEEGESIAVAEDGALTSSASPTRLPDTGADSECESDSLTGIREGGQADSSALNQVEQSTVPASVSSRFADLIRVDASVPKQTLNSEGIGQPTNRLTDTETSKVAGNNPEGCPFQGCAGADDTSNEVTTPKSSTYTNGRLNRGLLEPDPAYAAQLLAVQVGILTDEDEGGNNESDQ